MTTDYDEGRVAKQYQQAKEQLWRSRVEAYSVMKLLGDMRSKKVIDLACGEGYFTRKIRQAGASTVCGSDISERMIELARQEEERHPLGIEYRVEDAREIVPQQDFDLAFSAWLLVYAHDRGELSQMCQGLARRIRTGGRLVTITTNPEVYFFQPPPDYRWYGFEMKLADHVYEGAPILWTIHLDDSTLQIENYYLPVSAYGDALQDAGFSDITIHPLELAPDPSAGQEQEYWADILNYPIGILIDAIRT